MPCVVLLLVVCSQPWLTKAKALKDAYDDAIRANPSLARSSKESSSATSGIDLALPLARVKKLMDLDPAHSKTTKEAIVITEKATVRATSPPRFADQRMAHSASLLLAHFLSPSVFLLLALRSISLAGYRPVASWPPAAVA